MAKWKVEFYGEVEVEADQKEDALFESERKFSVWDHGTAEPLDGWCDYCENGAATVYSPYWHDGEVCQKCFAELEEENAGADVCDKCGCLPGDCGCDPNAEDDTEEDSD